MFPSEIYINIFKYIDKLHTLSILLRVSKHFNEIINDNFFWNTYGCVNIFKTHKAQNNFIEKIKHIVKTENKKIDISNICALTLAKTHVIIYKGHNDEYAIDYNGNILNPVKENVSYMTNSYTYDDHVKLKIYEMVTNKLLLELKIEDCCLTFAKDDIMIVNIKEAYQYMDMYGNVKNFEVIYDPLYFAHNLCEAHFFDKYVLYINRSLEETQSIRIYEEHDTFVISHSYDEAMAKDLIFCEEYCDIETYKINFDFLFPYLVVTSKDGIYLQNIISKSKKILYGHSLVQFTIKIFNDIIFCKSFNKIYMFDLHFGTQLYEMEITEEGTHKKNFFYIDENMLTFNAGNQLLIFKIEKKF